MKTKLIEGKDLTKEQISQLPYNGALNPEWIKCHLFWFSLDGTKLSTNLNEYYPVCKSLSFLPYGDIK